MIIKFSCSQCSATFTALDDLKEHLRIVHGNIRYWFLVSNKRGEEEPRFAYPISIGANLTLELMDLVP